MTGLASSRSATTVARDSASAWSLGVHVEPERLAGPHSGHPADAEGGQGPLDGGTLRVGDPVPQLHLDHHRVARRSHRQAPYQSASRSPQTRS